MATTLMCFLGRRDSALVMVLLVALVSATSPVQAATPSVVAGELVGASNVNVGGVLYDVEFVEGTCIAVFDGCDAPDDFAFSDLATVDLASQALVDQVFLDTGAGSFDTDTTSTYGCTNTSLCTAQTPYLLLGGDDIAVGIALNGTLEEDDGIADGQTVRTADSAVGVGQFYVFAVWTLSAVQAATPNVVAGKLVGASNVDVGGVLYDVEFVEGTCIGVFGGCDSADDFAFSDLATVDLASQALVDQVFLNTGAGNFDTEPASTLGCTNASLCTVQTPYLLPGGDDLAVGIAFNGVAETGDVIGDGQTVRTADSSTGAGQFYVFGVWTPAAIPSVPGPGLLVALALLGAGGWAGRRSTG